MITREALSLLETAKKSILLLGPRQTGKSTLIRSLKPDLEINLSDEETFVRFLRDPGLLKDTVRDKKRIFIDEVQRIPSLLNTVQYLLDKDKSLKFYLTGSSARKLKRGQANLLPGRVLTYSLGPLTPFELGEGFDVKLALSRGLLPEAYLEEDQGLSRKLLRSYSATYLREEVQAEALTRNLEGFSRFFEVVASRSGDFMDFSKFSSQAMIERTSAKRYFEILVDTLILHPVEAFSKSARRRLVQHPRYYFFDVGVLNGCLGNFDASADRIGNLFEHLVLQCLWSIAHSNDIDLRISVYRTEAGAEVDFIIEKGGEVTALEVKATKNIGVRDVSGLESFRQFYKKPHRSMIAYLGKDALRRDHVEILPLLEALQAIFEK